MNKINKYKNRFYNLMESTMGDVRPIVSEQLSNTGRKVPPVTGNQTKPIAKPIDNTSKPITPIGQNTKPIAKPISKPTKPQEKPDNRPIETPNTPTTQSKNFVELFKNGISKIFKNEKVQLNGDTLSIGNIKIRLSGNKLTDVSIPKIRTVDGQLLPNVSMSLNIDLSKVDLNSAFSTIRKTIDQLNKKQSSSFKTTVKDRKVMTPNLPNQGTPLSLEESIIRRIIKETEEEFSLKSKLNDIFFGHDPMNITSKEGEFGYLSGEHRLSKRVSPKQRIRRIENVISQLEDYIQTLKSVAYGEQGYVDNPEYESNWGQIDSGEMTESEDKDLNKFDSYATGQFTDKGFKKVNDKKYTKGDWSIEYKYYPEHEIDGFVAKYKGQVKLDKPADACWVWFEKQTF